MAGNHSQTGKISQKDVDILRSLGEQIAQIAALPVHRQKAELWGRMNQLEHVRPLVWINEIPWHEMNVDDELTVRCSDPWAQALESNLRRTIYQWKHMPADMVVSEYISCPLVIHDTRFGLEEDVDVVRTDDDCSAVYSRHFHPQIVNPEDIDKIQMSTVTYDAQATEENYRKLCEIFEDVIAVKKEGIKHIWFTPWDNLIRWWGVEQAMMDLVLRPEMVNAIVSRMVDSCMCGLDQLEKMNLLTGNHDNTRIGSGGYGYIPQWPGGDYDAEHVTAQAMWGCSNAQIFSEVSPEMHWEFALKHDMRWLQRWGLTYYGCCEQLDNKIDLMKRIPNLRKISMSPWIRMDRAVERIGDNYVFSRKPNPAILAEDRWNVAQARREVRECLDKTRNCCVEIILKDISTVRYEPRRLWEWETAIMELVEEYA